eukprot:14428973-Heterocapsa_arctica.AAC.1
MKIAENLGVLVEQQRLIHGSTLLQHEALTLSESFPSSVEAEVPVELSLLIRSPAVASMLRTLKLNPLALEHASEELKADREV